MQNLILLELNEVNFEAVQAYAARGELPTFKKLIEEFGLSETTSESRYEELEPWIQWVTAHSGLSLAEHGVFRLGDIVNHDIEQIWEQVEREGMAVGAMSPMNAKNRTKNACYFVPDPWTNTEVTGSYLLRKLYRSISQAVNDNSQSTLKLPSLGWLLAGVIAYARPKNYFKYLSLAVGAHKKPWYKAIFLDLLLADVFIRLTHAKRPEFTSLFVNAGAHIQHHYMFNSAVYAGDQKNPAWYINGSTDPVLDVYRTYDDIVDDVLNSFPDARIMFATGLHQDPHPVLTYYWRLSDHASFLRKIGADFDSVEPRMSRDFLVRCRDHCAAKKCAQLLDSVVSFDGVPLFEVDNRGDSLFVMLTYPKNIDSSFVFRVGERDFRDLANDVAFVAIKNGQHNGIGYFFDTGVPSLDAPGRFPLSEIPSRVLAAASALRRQR